MKRILLLAASIFVSPLTPSFGAAEPTFGKVADVFSRHCLDCHSNDEPDAQFSLETHEALMKGGESGAVIIPGQSSESLLVKMIEGRFEKDGKTKFMPPGKREKLTPVEIAVVRAWIDAGALPLDAEGAGVVKEIAAPKITPKVPPANPVYALAFEPKNKLLALARHGQAELYSAEAQALLRTFEGHTGNVQAVVFSPAGATLWAAGGESGITGEVRQWSLDGSLARSFRAHNDSVYALAVSPDGKWIATGSYDQKIKIWDASSGEEIRTLSGHNGCVYALAWRPDGKILASASGDRTVKLWDPATGERRDTLSQSLKELYTVAFSPDGKRLAAAGVDNRIRVWEISESAAETTNPLLVSKFAHESPVLRVVYSSDGKSLASAAEDKTVKLWDAAEVREKLLLPPQPDWAAALAFILGDKALAVGRMDGSLAFYQEKDGSVLPPPKPEIASLRPRGFQRGVETEVRIRGKNLHRVRALKFKSGSFTSRIAKINSDGTELTAIVQPDAASPRDSFELAVHDGAADSAFLKYYVDDLPHVYEGSAGPTAVSSLPAILWGDHLAMGETDRYTFSAKEGETLVFDAAANALGSKASLVLTLLDAEGRVLATNNGFDKHPDPLLAHTFAKGGPHTLEVSEQVLAGSPEHFYRVSAGPFPFVKAVFPTLLNAGEETAIQLIGYNLPADAGVKLKSQTGEVPVPLNPDLYRWRGAFKASVSDKPHQVESENNNEFSNANSIAVGSVLSGRIQSMEDEDWFRFEAKAGQQLVIETTAAQNGSPLDSILEVRDATGKPVVRTLLQAVRDSAVTFRAIDSITVDCRVDNWEEMELNQFLYLQGEVVRLFRMPQGPDSGFNFYALNGRRRNYFDTTATAHANGEPCYIVEPHPPGTKLLPNGLPVFEVHYENDDDADRRLGTDSRVNFTAPSDGTYHIRVRDTRGFASDRYLYRLTVREARPDFRVTLHGANPKVPKGSGQSFSVVADRIDGFEGDIRVEITGMPPGFTVSNPVVIQAGHTTAQGTIYASSEAPAPSPENESTSKVVASASVNGQTVSHDVNSLGKITLADSAPLYVSMDPSSTGPAEIILAPGQTVPAWLRVKRKGHNELVTFTVENLPHGIIVDNIGLNGVLIPKDQSEREIFLTAAKWVPETDRFCHAVSNEGGRQTSAPLLIKVRKAPGQVAGK